MVEALDFIGTSRGMDRALLSPVSTRPRTKLGALALVDPEAARRQIHDACEKAGNVEASAPLLGVSVRQLWRLIARLGLQKPDTDVTVPSVRND